MLQSRWRLVYMLLAAMQAQKPLLPPARRQVCQVYLLR